MSKKYFLYAIVLSLVLTSIGVAAYASQTQETGFMNGNGIVARIAQKFNLSESDVQSVFSQHNTEMKANFQQKVEDKLTQAVTDGKLTQAQMDLILAKKAELQAQMPTINHSPADREVRQAEAKARQDALKQWTTDNGIPEKYLSLICGMNGKGGRGMGNGIGNNFPK